MDQRAFDVAWSLADGIVMHNEYKITDAVELVCWLQDHKPVKVTKNNNGFLCLCYCGRCSTIVQMGDKYCNQCGRALIWE